jgi:hypothetical protein
MTEILSGLVLITAIVIALVVRRYSQAGSGFDRGSSADVDLDGGDGGGDGGGD